MARARPRPTMWLRSVFLKTLRDYRVPILGWGIGMGLVVVSPMASVATFLSTPQAREQLVGLAATFAWNADVVAVDTIGGYATFKIGIFIFLIAVWPLLAASRMLRGDEEAGTLDVLLSVPRPRLRVALEKVAAMWTALICAVIGGLALLISQFTQERGTAAGWTAGLLLIFIVLDMVHRVVASSEWISRLSPLYYYDQTKALVPGYGVNVGAMLLLLALTL